MMRRLVASLCLVLATAIAAVAQPGDIQTIQSYVGDVGFYVSNNGLFALNSQMPNGSFVVPRESTTSYLFGAGLWFGAQKLVDGEMKKLVFVTYNPNSAVSWARPGEHHIPELKMAGLPDTNVDPYIYNSVHFDRYTGAYLGGDLVPAWPLRLGKDVDFYEATPLRTGIFDPYLDWRGHLHAGSGGASASPAFVAGVDEQMVTRYHDDALDRYEIINGAERAGFPIGLQVEQMVYAWKEGKYRHVVLVQYHIRNISPDTLFDCVIGQVSDPDLGESTNDHTRFYDQRPEIRAAYAWTDPDTTTFGTLLMALIEAPNTDTTGFIDNSDRARYRMGGRVGAFPAWSSETDPKTSTERYDFMTYSTYTGDRGSGDQRSLIASTRFSMRPGDTAHFAVMYAVLDSAPPLGTPERFGARGIASAGGWSELEQLVLSLNIDYYSRYGFFNGSPVDVTSAADDRTSRMMVMPNPATDAATVRFQITARTSVRLRLVNALGQTLMRRDLGLLSAGGHEERIDLTSYPSGLYMAVIETDAGAYPAPLTIRR